MRARTWMPGLALLLVALVFAGCSSKESGSQEEATRAEASHDEAMQSEVPAMESATPVTWDEAEMAILAYADETDGTVDHVVAKCANCQLHMDGKPEFAVQAGDYEIHFCSDRCKNTFSEDMHASLQKISLPEETGMEGNESH